MLPGCPRYVSPDILRRMKDSIPTIHDPTPGTSSILNAPILPLLLLAAAMLLFGFRAFTLSTPTYYGLADEHGYLTTAKRFATTGSFAQHQPDPYAFIGETMMQSARDPTTYYLRQPIGYPLLCALAYKFGGQDAPFDVNPLLGLALLGGIYVVGKELGSALMGAVAAILVAAHPLVLYYTATALSHIPDMAAATWLMVFALVWRRERRIWQAAIFGLLLGIAILIRYTNALLCIPLLVMMIPEFVMRRRRTALRAAMLAAAVMVVTLIPLAIYQATAFGSPFRTGYSAGGNGTSFSFAWLIQHAPAMGNILLQPGTGLSALLIGIIIGIVVLARKDRSTLAFLLAWAIPPLLLYTAYYGMPESNTVLYARFALSSFVPLILLGVIWTARVMTRRTLALAITLVLATATAALSFSSPFMSGQLTDLNFEMLFMLSTRDLVQKNVPAGAIVIADDVTHYFLDYAGDYTIYDPNLFRYAPLVRRLADLRHSPHEFDPLRTRQLADLLGGKSQPELDAILRSQILRYQQGGRPVYLVTSVHAADLWKNLLATPINLVDANNMKMGVYKVATH